MITNDEDENVNREYCGDDGAAALLSSWLAVYEKLVKNGCIKC